MPEPTLYPLKFAPIYKEKVWGGRTLQQTLQRDLPGDAETPIGESWELVDLATTSASGGGGGAERSVVTNGPLAGQSLSQIIQRCGRDLLGDLPLSGDGGFPVLLKYLDANQNLSVQVHPSPEYAEAHDDAFLKSESWYIVAAEPGAVIYKGIKEGVTPQQLREAIATNTDEAVVPLMIEVPVRAGDCHYVPSGTCHALGAGILVAEVQTPSDTTYRVYDWGRTGRELHVDQALACIHFGPPQVDQYELFASLSGGEGAEVQRLVACEFFRIDRVSADAGFSDQAGAAQPTLWMVLEGSGRLTGAGFDAVDFVAGDTILLPPMAAGEGMRVEVGAAARWLEISFPQADSGRLA